MVWAVIFDWDGVVVDSSEAHSMAWEQLAREEKRTLPEDHMERGFGRKNADVIPNILQWTTDEAEMIRLSERKESLYRQFLEDGHGLPLPGARALLRRLSSLRVPSVVGSSAPRANIEHSIKLFGLEGLFHDIASAEDCQAGKPAPDIFLAAAAKAGVSPKHCIVLEDAPHGIEAAHRAGMKAVGVLTSHGPERLAEADLLVSDLMELTVSSLMELLGEPAQQKD